MELYFNCKTRSNFNQKESLCCELLGIPNDGTNQYAKPLVDLNGDNWLLINDDVVEILTQLELESCIPFEELQLEETSL